MTEAKRQAKERDGYECVFCGMDNDSHREEHGRGVHAHHIIKERDNGHDEPENYLTVCRDCHNTIEHTQADALSQLRENIIATTNAKQAEWMLEMLSIIREVIEIHTDVPVKRGHYYYHLSHGVVYVESFAEETIGARADGVVSEVIVNFNRPRSESDATLTEPLTHFDSKTSKGAKHSHDLETELKTHFERELRK